MLNMILFLLPFLAAPSSQPTSQAKVKTVSEDGVTLRGAALSKGKVVSLDVIAKDPASYSGKTLIIAGTTSAVCKKKGCWMGIVGSTPQARARITFKDYAFFVPKNIEGMKVKVEGTVEVKVMSEGERKHLAEDGKVDISMIPKAELRIVALGVELRK